VVLVYVGTALVWCGTNDFYARGPRISWPEGNVYTSFVAELCGPLQWVVVPLWLWPEGHLGSAVAVTLVAVGAWAIWLMVVFRTRLLRAPLPVHFTLGLLWFGLGPFVVGVGVWLGMMWLP
jgi:hypothetical protein